MRRFVTALSVVGLLLFPIGTFADDGQIGPPIGAHSITQPSRGGHLSFWDIVLMVWSDTILQPPIG